MRELWRRQPGRIGSRAGKVLLLLAALGGLGLFGLEAFIRYDANLVARNARERFGGDRAQALAAMISCETCRPGERKMAVWALGQLGYSDREAMRPGLAALYKYYDGHKCDHETKLCQYELWKAIRKIEGTWDLRASFFREGTVRGLER